MVLFAALDTLLAPSRAGLAFTFVLPTTETIRIMKLICGRRLSVRGLSLLGLAVFLEKVNIGWVELAHCLNLCSRHLRSPADIQRLCKVKFGLQCRVVEMLDDTFNVFPFGSR